MNRTGWQEFCEVNFRHRTIDRGGPAWARRSIARHLADQLARLADRSHRPGLVWRVGAATIEVPVVMRPKHWRSASRRILIEDRRIDTLAGEVLLTLGERNVGDRHDGTPPGDDR